jgi:hypothetical protein
VGARGDHIVPRFYLAGFTDDQGMLNVHRRDTRKWWKSKPENAWRIDNYYPGDLDRGVNQRIENAVAPILRDGGFLSERRMPTEHERHMVAEFVASFRVRAQQGHASMDEGKASTARRGVLLAQVHLKDNPDRFTQEIARLEEMLGVMIAGASLDASIADITITSNSAATMQAFYDVLPVPTKLIERMPWAILAAQGDDVFITSDQPLIQESMGPFGRSGMQVSALTPLGFHFLLPLTQKFALAAFLSASADEPGYSDASTALVAHINAETWGQATAFAYASRQDYTGHQLVANYEAQADFLDGAIAKLPEQSQPLAGRILNVLGDSDADAVRDSILAEFCRFHLRDEVEPLLGFVDGLLNSPDHVLPGCEARLKGWLEGLAQILGEGES